jgi:murein DD-endopeptidase MepM/ murein hydrolase activator NlpD
MQKYRQLAVTTILAMMAHGAAAQQGPRLMLEPRGAAGGSLVRLTIDRLGGHSPDDSVTAVTGTMAGEPLHFRLVSVTGGDRLLALGAVPLGVSDSLVAHVEVDRASGAVDTLHLVINYAHQPPPAPQASVSSLPSRSRRSGTRLRRLRVDRQFTQRLDSATEARVESENELVRSVGRRAQDTPQLWSSSFLRPRQSRVTSRFGTGRLFNGRVASAHLGIDFRGAEGDAIFAANRGVVALVTRFFLAGNVVYLDHGDGIVTGYFHMSQSDVAVGDTVERGQEIGRVGATGRVTGPHLHWSARFGALTIDPGDLLDLRAPFVQPTAGARTAAAPTRGRER